jgi:putative DNA primase/helicase
MEQFNYGNIPQELKKIKNWVCWGDGNVDLSTLSHEERRMQKLPKNPHTGGNAMANNPDTWGTFIEALAAKNKYNFKGLGFMLGCGYFGVDLDHCEESLKNEFVTKLNSYSEYSMSGEGVHIICKGILPQGQRRKNNIEMYEKDRYFIMTGNVIENIPIRNCTEEIKELHAKYLAPQEPEFKPLDFEYIANSSIDMLDIGLEKDTKLSNLWNSFPSGSGGNESETDLALLSKIAYWCNGDFNAIKNRFLESPYYSRKDDYHKRKIDRDDYINATIDKAIKSLKSTASIDNEKYKQEEMEKAQQKMRGNLFRVDEETGEVMKVYENNDTGNAQRLIDRFGNLIRFNDENNSWYIYNGKRWKADDTLEIKRFADIIIKEIKLDAINERDRSLSKEMYKNIDRVYSSKGKESMIKEARHLDGIPVTNKDFDNNGMILNVNNGYVDLVTGELHDHDDKLMLNKIVNVDYDSKATCPRWLQFLDEIFLGDKELINWIQMAVGYSLTASMKEQCMFFLYGEGSNGKSVFLDTIKKIMGSYGLNAQSETLMAKKAGQGEQGGEVARLKGARFVTTVESNQGVKLNEGLVKQLTGDDVITARFLYGKPFEFKPTFKIWMATNHKPIIRGRDNGIWRRIMLVPFNATFSGDKIDKDLPIKLSNEISGILNWALEGTRKWLNGEMKTPSSVMNTTKEYRKEMDIIQQFLDECVVMKEEYQNARVKAGELFKVFDGWSRDLNELNKNEISSTLFGREMTKLVEKKNISGCNYYLNIEIKEDYRKYLNNYRTF